MFAGLARVEIHLERHHDDEATAALDELEDVCVATHRVTLQALVRLQQTRLARVVGDEARAVALLDQARLVYADPDEAVIRVLAEEAVEQALRFEPSRAATLIAGLDPNRPATRILEVRLALVERDDRLAASILAELPPPTSRRRGVERCVLDALGGAAS